MQYPEKPTPYPIILNEKNRLLKSSINQLLFSDYL